MFVDKISQTRLFQRMIELLGESIADMMDTDCESRISAHCAYNRIFGITRQTRSECREDEGSESKED